MSAGWTMLAGWAVMALAMTGVWWFSRRRDNAGYVDVAWAAGVGLLAVGFAASATDAPLGRRLLVAALGAMWGVRLAWHLWKRVGGEREDGRYRDLRQRWGERQWFYMFLFFQAQAIWAVLFAAPMLGAAASTRPFPAWTDALGVAVWLFAVIGEGVADRQLARFRARADARGRVCREGLWRYSRHPNYFFEWLHWWAYVAIGIAGPLGGLTLLGPFLMLVFLFTLTGIPPTEAQALRSRGEAYRRYQREVSVFIPWFARESQRS